jgi:hypothetical protein
MSWETHTAPTHYTMGRYTIKDGHDESHLRFTAYYKKYGMAYTEPLGGARSLLLCKAIVHAHQGTPVK